jgi:hypothetical protein
MAGNDIVKKLLMLGVLGAAFCLVAPSLGQSAEILYGKVDGFYGQVKTDKDELAKGAEINTRFRRPWKVNADISDPLTDLLPLESESAADYPLESFRHKLATLNLNFDGDATTCMRVVKFRGDAETVKPFFVFGGGHLDTRADGGRRAGTIPASGPDSGKDTGAKVGIGVDVCASDDMLVGLEGSHVWAFDGSRDPRSFALTLGIAYHF